MGILDKFKTYKAKKQGAQVQEYPSSPIQAGEQEVPSEELSVTEINTPSPLDPAPVEPQQTVAPAGSNLSAVAKKTDATVDATPSWVKAGSYEEASKMNPKISRGQYAYELGKYRRAQGQPDMSYTEWANIIQGNDPFETEEDRQKREKNMKIARQINALGTFLNALVNYNRVKRGHVGYTPDKGTDTYNRLERMRMGQEQLAKSRSRDYLDALVRDRAERAKADAAEAAAKQAERNYELRVKDLEWKIENAKTEAGRKAAADELARAKFEWQKQKDEAKLKETKRQHQASEATARERASRGNNKHATSAMDADGNMWTRNTSLSKEEAMQLVMSSEYGKDKGFLDDFRATTTTTGDDGETIRVGDVNWFEAASYLMANKKIPADMLRGMGYKGKKADPDPYEKYNKSGNSDFDRYKVK